MIILEFYMTCLLQVNNDCVRLAKCCQNIFVNPLEKNSQQEEEETYSNHSQGPFPLLNSTKASKKSDQENNSPKANENVGRGRDGCVMTVDGYQFLDVYRVWVYFKPNPCAEYATTGKLKTDISDNIYSVEFNKKLMDHIASL